MAAMNTQYEDLLRHVRDHGTKKSDRTGTGTTSIFGHQLRYDLAEGFPLITTKRVHLRSVVHELLWFLKRDSNIAYLRENGVRIWNEWADDDGELGPVYGLRWGRWPAPGGGRIPPIAHLLERLRARPAPRGLLVSARHVGGREGRALMPCAPCS